MIFSKKTVKKRWKNGEKKVQKGSKGSKKGLKNAIWLSCNRCDYCSDWALIVEHLNDLIHHICRILSKKINHDFHPELNQGPADLQSAAPTIKPPRVCIQSNKHQPPSVYRARAREQNTTSEREIVRPIGMHQCSARAAQNTWNSMRLWGWLWWLFSLLSRSRARAKRLWCHTSNNKMSIDTVRQTECTVHDCVHV